MSADSDDLRYQQKLAARAAGTVEMRVDPAASGASASLEDPDERFKAKLAARAKPKAEEAPEAKAEEPKAEAKPKAEEARGNRR